MTWYRKNPLFASALTLCALLVLGEGWLIYDRVQASLAAARKIAEKEAELGTMRDLTPPPTRPVATAIEADLARAKRSVAVMQAELKGKGPAAERLASAKAPAARTEAYFDLATFIEKTRDLAKKNDVEIRPEAARLGFALYANEGPKEDRIASVFHQRQVIQYVLEALIEARPRSIMLVQRERALNNAEKAAIAFNQIAAQAALTGAPSPEPPPEPAPGTVSAPETESPDLFEIDPRVTARAPGYLTTTPVRLVFTGQTGSLRTFLNKLASFELPVLVREVEVDRAAPEDAAATPADEGAPADDPAAASIVINAKKPAPASAAAVTVPTPKPSTAMPIVAKPLSKFTVTVEYLDLVPPPAPPAAPGSDAPAGEAKPATDAKPTP